MTASEYEELSEDFAYVASSGKSSGAVVLTWERAKQSGRFLYPPQAGIREFAAFDIKEFDMRALVKEVAEKHALLAGDKT